MNSHMKEHDASKRIAGLVWLLSLLFCTSTQAQLVCTADVQGPNDPSGDGQADITQLCIDESGLPASFELEFSWDDNSFSGNNTGDACVLFDLDGDAAGNIDHALCTSVGGDPGSLVAGPTFYTCSGQNDRCGNPQLAGGGGTVCAGQVENTDPFSNGDDFPEDTVVNCTVDTSDIPPGWVRTNFCSFPSSQPNSNPKDCIGYVGGGFIEISKRAFPDDATSAATSFSFSISGTGTEQGLPVTVNEIVNVNGNSTNAVSVPQGGPYTVAETALPGWTVTDAECDNGTVTGSTVTGVNVAASSTTQCEFSNLRSGSITILKSASPADGTDFSFSGDLGIFTLDVDTTPALSDNISFDSLAPGTYTVTETATPPFILDSIVCEGDDDSGSIIDLSQRQVAIDFDASEGILCTFTNLSGTDLALTKALDTAGPYTVGQTLQYTLVVSNGGPNTATAVTVSDTPTNLTINSVSSTPLGTCTALPCTLASLANGASETITVLATIDAAGAFDNAAAVAAAETDPDPDNNSDNSGNGGTAAAAADLALTKALDTAGPYTVGQTLQYTLVVSNGGPNTATAVTVSDTPTNLTINSVSSTPLGTCTALPCTLASLANGASETITVLATIDAAGAFDNAAAVAAAETDPDPDNNSDNSGNGGTAEAAAEPVLGVAKTTGSITDNGDGTFSTTVTITLENLGDAVLQNLQAVDDLTAAFPAPATFSVSNLTSATLFVNALFDGSADTNLLAGTDALAAGTQATVNFVVTFDPMGLPGPFLNSASGTAQSSGGDVTTDVSDDGTEPDSNGNGDPGDPGEDDATPIAFTEAPVLGVAKAASPATDNGNGTFTTTVTITLENHGNVVLQDVQVRDDLSAVFPAPASFTVANVTSPLLSANASFDGVGDIDLLLGTDVLAVGQLTTVAFDVTFDPNVLSGPFANSAIGEATGPGGASTGDVSDEGNTSDANGDGDPGGPGEDDPTQIGFVAIPEIGLAKTSSPTTDNGDGTFTTTITLLIENLGNVLLQNVQISDDLSAAFPAPATVIVNSLTSATLATDDTFDGVGNQNILLGTDTLGVGLSATVSFSLTFDPAGLTGPFGNSAIASGESPGGSLSTDPSDSGSDPDPNADGDPGGPGEDDPTAITFIENPVLGVAKSANPTSDNGDGSFTTTITLTLENLGNVVLQDLQISDDLSAAFPAPATVNIANVTSPLLSLNPAYDGVSDINLLLGSDSLPVASAATVTFDVTFDPAGLAGPFSNMAIGDATGPGGSTTSDRSDNGTETDSSGDGDPGGPGEDDPTSITFVEDPVVDIAKSASPTIDNLDGTFTTTITLLVENLGNVVLNDLAITDDLTATFPASVSFTVANLNSVSLTTNPGFDGAFDTDLLAGTDVLPVGASATLAFDITFNPGALPGPFLNTAIASATGPGGAPTSDRSNSGNDPDPNGDGDPSIPDEDVPTPIGYVERPVLGVAKAAGPAIDSGNGTFTTTVTVTLENLGNVLLNDVQLIDDLTSAFPAPATYTVSNLTSTNLSANPAFDGAAVTALLAGTDTLLVGQTATVKFDLTFNPASLPGPFFNLAQGSGSSPSGTISSDLSDSGSDPDANGNGDPGDPDENDPTVIGFTEDPVLGLAKAVGATIDNGDGNFTTTVTITLENLGNVVLQNLQAADDLTAAFPAPSTFAVSNLTSAVLTVNALFDGVGDTNLLAGTDSLAVGAIASVSFDIIFNPQGLPGPFLNSATAAALSPAGSMSSDLSDDGTEPDANGNGNPGDPGENDPSPITFTGNPVLGVAKAAGPAIDLGGGSFETSVTLTIENLGNVVLSGVSLTDDLAAVFPAPATFGVSNLNSTTLTVNPAFNGSSDIEVLAGAVNLAVGELGSVSFTLTFQPNGVAGPFQNVAIGGASGPSGSTTSDRSDNGTVTDSNGDGNPGGLGEDDPTLISFEARPVIGAAKATTASIDNADGTFSTTVTLVIENLGNVVLSNVQINDDLQTTFPSPATLITSAPNSSSLSVNPGFDGAASTNLLNGTDTLGIGDSASVSFDLTFAPNGASGPFGNTAIASATDAGGQTTSDRSADGNDPDPNGDGDPSLPNVEDTPTQISFPEKAVLGIAKEAGVVTDNFDDTFTVPLTIHLENLGNVVLTEVQVSDDLRAFFPSPAVFTISELMSPDLNTNPGFDGDSDINLLLGTDTLSPGMTAEVSFNLTVSPIGLPEPFINQANGSAATSAGTPVTDISTDGSDPDPDANGDPNEMKPTLLLIPALEVEIPTLNPLGLLILIMLLSGIAVWRLRA